MADFPVKYAVLRDRRQWAGAGLTLTSLTAAIDGTLQLTRTGTAAATGSLVVGPLDAGELGDWERVCVTADAADGTVSLEFSTDSTATAAGPIAWTRAAAIDTLVMPFNGSVGARRYVWIRVTLNVPADAALAPTLAQVEAQTVSPSYLDHLPAVYRRRDDATVLERWLALFRSELGDAEREIVDVSRLIDAAMTSENHLAWVASWLGFPLPDGIDGEAARELIVRVPELYRRRGTPQGVADFVEIYAGVRPHLDEAFCSRAIWQLGVTSRLGFETALVPAPDGMIVAGDTFADPDLMGVRGEYYDGVDFDNLRATRTDSNIDFTWAGAPHPAVQPSQYSVRWTGQVRPRYSEPYTFSTISDDGVRLWIDGLLVIDNWTDHAATEDVARVTLRAGHWHKIRLEYYQRFGAASIRLAWASPSQRPETIPHDRLYSLIDDGVLVDDAGASSTSEASTGVVVGSAVVGESAPQTKSQFGALLFSESAHRFSALIPAASTITTRQQTLVRQLLESEKPAHTDYELCCVQPRLRVGVQATIGIDAIVGGPPDAMRLSGAVLGLDTWLGPDASPAEPCDASEIVDPETMATVAVPRT